MKVTLILIVICTIKTIPQRIYKGTGRLVYKRISSDHLDHSITNIGQNTEKSPGDLRKLTVTQTPVGNH